MQTDSPVTARKNSTNVRKFNGTRLAFGLASRLARHSPALALALARYAFLTPPRHGYQASERIWLETARRMHIHTLGLPVPDLDQKRVQVYAWGEARAGRVLLVHGWGGRGTQMAGFIAPLLALGYEVLALDAPGHGLSEGRRSSLPQFANAIERTVAAFGPVDAVLTHSFGGIALAYAASQGLRFDKAVLIAPPSDPDFFVTEILRQLALPSATRTALMGDIERRFSLRWNDIDIRQLAPGLRQSALVIHDRDDREVPYTAGAAVAAHWPGARLLSTRGLGHKRILNDATVIASALAFLCGHTEGGDGGQPPPKAPRFALPLREGEEQEGTSRAG